MNKLIRLSKALSLNGQTKEANIILALSEENFIKKTSGSLGISDAIEIKNDIESIRNFKNLPKPKKSEVIHNVLRYIGKAPGIGTAADVLNVILYATEGQYYMAAISAISLVPGLDRIIPGILRSGKDLSPQTIISYGSSFLTIVKKLAQKIPNGASLIQAAETVLSEAKEGKTIPASSIQSVKQKSAVAINDIDINSAMV